MSGVVGSVAVRVVPSMSGFGSTLAKEGGAAASKQGRLLGGIMGKALVGGLAVAGVAVAGFSAYALKEFSKFEKGMNEVFTLLPGISEEAMGKMNDDTRKFVREMGIAHDEAVPALYSAISAGVPKENVFDFMEIAAQASIGGVTDLETAVDGITSVVNAYGEENVNAQEASDMMFTAVKNGKTTFDELSGSLFNVIPTASALGVGFEDITGGLAQMTAMGTPTSVATTQLRQLFVELSKDGSKVAATFEEVSGKSFKDFIAEGGNTQEALALLSEEAEKSGIGINDMFGSVEAGSAALSLSGQNAEGYAENIAAMADSAGATEAAYNTMDEGIARSMERIGIQFKDAAIEIGENLAPTAQRFADFLQDHLPGAIDTASSAIESIYDVIASVADVIFNRALPALRDFGDYATDTLVPALKDFWGWMKENKTTIGVVAGVITAIMLPALVRLGVTALVSGAQAVAGWVMQRVAAVQAGVAYVVQSIKIIGTWIAMGAAAVASGAQTAYVWLLYRLDAIRAAGVMIAQRARIVGAWIAMSAAAVASGARTAVVWAVQVVGAAAAGAARFAVSAARVVAGWVLMSLQSLLHAGRMAAAWFIALGPIGWVTATVIAIAALVIANWDKIAYWTKKIWTAIVDWVVGAWVSIRDRTTQLLTAIANWVRDRFNWIRDTTVRIWSAIRDFISDAWVAIRTRVRDLLAQLVSNIRERFNWVRDFSQGLWQTFRDRIVRIWESVRDNIVSIWDNGIKKPLGAMKTFFTDTIPGWVDKGADMIRKAWRAVQEFFAKPINWVINEVWNGGIRSAFNSVADTLNMPDSVRIGKIDQIQIPQYAKGGNMGSGWKLVGEEGPELINTGPGWVARADQTKRLLNGDVAEGQHVRPMGGPAAWVSKIGSGLSSAWDTAKGWVLGGLANMAEATFAPLISKATTAMSEHGMMGQLGGGLVDWGFKNVLDWIRGKDNEVSANGEYEGAFTANPGGFNRPSQGPITSGAGPRNLAGAYSNYHYGVDFGAAHNSPVRAAWSGVVKRASSGFGTFGNLIVLNHGGFDTAYAHLNGYAVKPGQTVTGGQIIGRQGNTGGSLGSHLHFERHPGGFYNPGEVNSLFRDKGGLLPPGVSSVLNNTGGNEFIFNQKQFENLNRLAERASGGGEHVTINQHMLDSRDAYRNAQEATYALRSARRRGALV